MLYIVMEEVRGRSLEEVASRGRPLRLRCIARWGQEVCRALEVAHGAGVVHRDLKPSNVMIDEEGRAVVLDFGIARVVEGMTKLVTLTPTGHAPGTPAYMSPEQARGDRNLDGRSDLYALGCVLYRLLTGTTPFGTGPWHVVLNGHLTQPPTSPAEHRPGLPAEWTELVLDLLVKASEDRPGSAAVVRERLAALPQRALASTPSSTGVASAPLTEPTAAVNGYTVAAPGELPWRMPRLPLRTWMFVAELVGSLNLGVGAAVAVNNVSVGGLSAEVTWTAGLVGAVIGGMLGHACTRFLQVRCRILNRETRMYLSARHPVDPAAVIWAAETEQHRSCRWALSEEEDGWALVHHHGRGNRKVNFAGSANGVVVGSDAMDQHHHERWRVVQVDFGYVAFVDLVDHMALQVAFGTPDPENVVKRALDGKHSQQWRLLSVEGVDMRTGNGLVDRLVAAVLRNYEAGLVGSTLLGLLAVEHLAVLSIAVPPNVLGWVVTELLIFVPTLLAAAAVASMTLEPDMVPSGTRPRGRSDGSIRVTTLTTAALVAVVTALSLLFHGASAHRIMITTPLVWVTATLSAIVLKFVTWPLAALI